MENRQHNRELVAGKQLVAGNLAGVLLYLYRVPRGKLFPAGASRTTTTATSRERTRGGKSCEYFMAHKSVEQLQPTCPTPGCRKAAIKRTMAYEATWGRPPTDIFFSSTRERRSRYSGVNFCNFFCFYKI